MRPYRKGGSVAKERPNLGGFVVYRGIMALSSLNQVPLGFCTVGVELIHNLPKYLHAKGDGVKFGKFFKVDAPHRPNYPVSLANTSSACILSMLFERINNFNTR
jgi:hypothetical protein